jgi:predicted DCC family thiol-disulfide oxidoreductase YuxK
MDTKALKNKIFVDGNCIVCDMEISHYQRIAPELFELVDISDPSFDASRFGLTAEAVNVDMHLLTTEGKLLIGVDAFAYIWSEIPRYRFASTLIHLPGIHAGAKVGYKIFTVIRPYLPKKKR